MITDEQVKAGVLAANNYDDEIDMGCFGSTVSADDLNRETCRRMIVASDRAAWHDIATAAALPEDTIVLYGKHEYAWSSYAACWERFLTDGYTHWRHLPELPRVEA